MFRLKTGLHMAVHFSGSLMRPYLLILLFVFLACYHSSSEQKAVQKDTIEYVGSTDSSGKVGVQDATKADGTVLYVWCIDFENKRKTRNPNLKEEYLNVDTLIRGLNQLHPAIKLEKVRFSNDTLFTRILDSEYLAERMGTSGAALYLAEVVINLTSVSKIRYVSMDFEEGSHASPGIWSAKDFLEYKEIR